MPEVDWLLQYFVGLAQDTGLELGVTLQAGGLLMSGQLVGGDKFLKGIAGGLRTASGNGAEFGKMIADGLEEMARLYAEPQEGKPKPTRTYIHLRDAKFLDAAGHVAPTGQGVWWRGRLTEITGFTIGAFHIAS